MLCPLCAAALPAEETKCPGCGADLSDYLNARYQPDLLFNEALLSMKRESWSEACALLCQAHSLRPEDPGILDLWMRAEYFSGNKKRALELMTDLLDLDDTAAREEQLAMLVEEYDTEQADTGFVVKKELQAQNDRLQALLDRLEDRLDAMDGAGPAPAAPAAYSPGPADPGDSADSASSGASPTGGDSAEDPSGFFPGGLPDFSQFAGMFPPPEP